MSAKKVVFEKLEIDAPESPDGALLSTAIREQVGYPGKGALLGGGMR